MDHHSQSEPHRVRVTHLALDITAQFDRKRLRANVELLLDRIDPAAPLMLDTTDEMHIDSVEGADGTPRNWRLCDGDPVVGRGLSVELEPEDDRVKVFYATGQLAGAVQWLEPSQTLSGQHPFLFTQGQAILTRSWIPLQDSPGVRVTYEAVVRAPEQLVALMSGEQRELIEPGVTRFAMSQAVPPYLIALAIGELERREISERCAVWAEPALVAEAAEEFSDMENMVQACEGLYGPYVWGRYDVLVLPPSFPFGGMENPCLTFATPTILAGDKSLVSLIAHELAHSWSGNLVTNATARDFWLNEGFTVYFERRILEALYGKERAEMECLLGMQELDRQLKELPPNDQILHIDLDGRNPDDAMTAVAYEKGAAFLRRLEQVFGRERFDAFLTGWFEEHTFQSVTTDVFLHWLGVELLAKDPELAKQIDTELWVTEPGLPADAPRPNCDAFAQVDAQREAWLQGGNTDDLDTGSWVTSQWLHFLNALPTDTSAEHLNELDLHFALTQSGNSEILAAWLQAWLRLGYGRIPAQIDDRLERFLMDVGRRKFVEPLFKALKQSDAGHERARQIYCAARPGYHPITSGTIDRLLGWPACP